MKPSKCIYTLRKLQAQELGRGETQSVQALQFALDTLEKMEVEPKQAAAARTRNMPTERNKGVARLNGAVRSPLGIRVSGGSLE